MIRGTTPTFTFNLPFETSFIKTLSIVIQNKKIGEKLSIEKGLGDCSVSEKSLSCTLSQEETLSFTYGDEIDIQLRILTTDDTAFASKIYTVSVDRILKDGVIS